MYSLQVEDIHERYDSHEVLRGVSPGADEGGVISVIGSSGSGKSTFLYCVNPLGKPCAGCIRVGDEELRTRPGTLGKLRTADPRQLQGIHGRLAVVFQHLSLWSRLVVLEDVVECLVNILRTNRDDAAAHTHHYLAKVGLAEKVERQYPCELSDGQQQRVVIVHALVIEPQVMLFDGLTSAPGPELVGEVLKVTQQLAEEGRTMVLITYEMAFARQVFSHVIFLHQGVIEEQGTPDQVFGALRNGRLRQFLVGNPK